jgi:antitoxin (DNA-binding transcriptional repressor) of toxin-antitoxin stability system
MKTTMLTVTEAVRNISDYIGRVAYRRESFVLCKGKRPVAELRPVPAGRQLGDLPEIFRSLPPLSKADAAVWTSELDSDRHSLPPMVAEGPWES